MEFKKFKKIMPGYLLVKPIVVVKTASGLYLQSEGNNKTSKAEVIMTSESLNQNGSEIKCPVSVGDVVAFEGQVPGRPIKVGGEELHLVEWNEVIGVLDE